ncbi:hypothetical protein FRC07_010861, partial [Ceratobasidium sp. 392]
TLLRLRQKRLPTPLNTIGSEIDMMDEEADELQEGGDGVGVLGEESSDEEAGFEREGEYESDTDETSTAEDFEETWEDDDLQLLMCLSYNHFMISIPDRTL